MVLICVTAYKGRHKIHSRWENREYVVKWQPYPNLPEEGHSHTMHRNYLLPISNNMEQEECEHSVGGDGHSDELTLIPHENYALPVDHPTKLS